MKKGLIITLLTVFALVFTISMTTSAEENADETYQTDLDIVSYNVYLMSSTLYPNWGQSQRADLIGQADFMSGQDVIILNELFDNSSAEQLLGHLQGEYPYQTPILGSTTSGWDDTRGSYSYVVPENGGVSVVSKWPIEEQIQYVFSEACGPESMSNKGFVYTKIMKDGDPYHIIGTHMQSTDSNCSDGEPAEVRSAQMAEMNQFIDDKGIPRSEMLIIGGDLNVIKDSAEYDAMLNQLNVSEPQYTGFDATWDPETNSIANYNYPDLGSQYLDYIFVSNNHKQPESMTLEARDVKSPYWSVTSWGTTYEYNDYSDHYPVFSEILN
ncbi:sphingomyelin phosphodiesterase [Aquisalibacillus elongatus]|uniref:Phospholipase C n=1 Tax=Aquisalibacillus elongatus TaxID=485577 RepID=A0A3N5BDW2_9BACI|nr:sphingomyelin phosphodiesterase [Aquisalibacillus elongatus]RPF53500.1 phospholipase C [Aquisalibacillus elongatus]